ncbi:hypothetical protein CDV55_102551 [Aspergillus turcosus]|uniref:Uncharacterized protein n=1 Tax=Aspergillus turcosus TaxID=1245748 RepID=A0A397HMD7_9EURO|nr:hypothetical protein CDV55_102551 [Aspergillus turcosus]RLL97875.1 hypothetical protein CFD26_106534 [Aspergillus turcosus]
MAEILGVVGSAISILQLVEQTIQTINRARALRAFMGTVSDDLEEFLDDTEIVREVLLALTPEMLNVLSLPLPLIERRLQKFQADLTVLASVIQSERERVAKNRRLAKFKLYLQKDRLQKQRDSLDNIRQTLLLLQQTYFSSTRRPKEPRHICPRKTQGTITFSFRTPLLFVDKFWNMNITGITSGWNFSIRSYNVIPDDSAIISHCEDGNIEEIQRLFDNRLASPFDCDEEGRTLLHMAADYGQVEVCKFLLQNGADPTAREASGLTPLESGNITRRVWVEKPRNLVNIDFLSCIFFGPPEALTLIQESLFVNYSSLPIEFRFMRAMSLSAWHFGAPSPDMLGLGGPSPYMLRIAMGGDSIDRAAYHLTSEFGRTLLFKIVAFMAVANAHSREENISGWRELIREAIHAGADLYHISPGYGKYHTPLMTFFDNYWHHFGAIRQARYDFHHILQRWALELQLAGVDLATYGAKESALWRSGAVGSFVSVYMSSSRYRPSQTGQKAKEWAEWMKVHLFSLSYGPNPADWHVWVSNPVDELVGEFWEMIERKDEIMPGAWIE